MSLLSTPAVLPPHLDIKRNPLVRIHLSSPNLSKKFFGLQILETAISSEKNQSQLVFFFHYRCLSGKRFSRKCSPKTTSGKESPTSLFLVRQKFSRFFRRSPARTELGQFQFVSADSPSQSAPSLFPLPPVSTLLFH